MARWTFAAIVALLVTVPLLAATSATGGELRRNSTLASGMVGYTDHQSQQSGDRIGGGSWSFDFSRMAKGGKWSAGWLLRRIENDEFFDTASSSEQIRVNAKRLVTGVHSAFYFLDGTFSPYVDLLIGVHMQTSDVYQPDGEDFRESSQTFATAFSAGTYLNITDGMFLRAEYTFHYFAKSDTIRNNHMHGIYGGLGFQFGGY